MIRKHRKLILFISIIVVILIWMPSTIRKRILLIPLKYQVWTPDNAAHYRYSDLKITQGQNEIYVDIYLRFVHNETECKRVISVVERYMKRHPNLFLNEAKIGIHINVAGNSLFFYNYHNEEKYDYFAKMGMIENSYYGYGLEYIEAFPDTKVLGCVIHDEPDMDEWIKYLSCLSNPKKIYFYCASDDDYNRMRQMMNEMFPECEVRDKSASWFDEEPDNSFIEEPKPSKKFFMIMETLILIAGNIIMIPSVKKKRFLLIPLTFLLWSRLYRLRFRRRDIQVVEKDGITYINLDVPFFYGAEKCKKIIFLIEKYMKRHPKSFLNKAKVSITVGNRPYTVSFFNYDDEKIYEYFVVLLYAADDEKNPLIEYTKAFPKCRILNE